VKASDAKNRLLRNPEVRREYEAKNLAREIARSVIIARAKAELSQAQLAERVGTKQPSIARIENGESLPSLSFLMKISQALGTDLTAPLLIAPSPKIRINSPDSYTAILGSIVGHSLVGHTIRFSGLSQTSENVNSAYLGVDHD
jgi:transcriptional regulator with XRE-family HTH domain